MLSRVSLCTLLLALLLAPSARADEGWQAPSGCPDRRAAERQLRALRADPGLLARGDARVRIDVAPSGELRGRVSLRHGDRVEKRTLYDRSCAALAEAVVLVISLSYEGAEERADVPAPKPADERWPRTLALTGLARVDGGSLPKPTLGVGGSLRAGVGRVIGELEVAVYLWREREHNHVRGQFGLAAGAGRVCFITGWRVLASCAAVEIGQADGASLNTLRARHARGLWAAALVGASFAFLRSHTEPLVASGPYRRLSPILDLELGVPFVRTAFDLEEAGTVFLPRSVIVRGSLRLALELWSRR